MTAYDLADRFRSGAPPTLLTGVQAIVRLLVEQRALDARRGRDVGFFVSGYQGSPLGGLDKMLAGEPELLRANAIHFQPGLNEEIAATGVWGSQTDLPTGRRRHDGVVGVWYGKAPGVDRATDALRHLTMYGVDPTGGVVLLAGDDPAAKSSTVPAVSERTLAALGIPVLFPRNAAEVVTLGLHAVALSRASGSPVALKIVADVADGAWAVDDAVSHLDPVTPQLTWDGEPWSFRQSPPLVGSARIVAVEAQLVGPRAAMVHAYARANDLDVVTVGAQDSVATSGPPARRGIIAAGPAYDSTMQALLDLGAGEDTLAAAGVRVLRVALITPLEPTGVRRFAEGLEEILVVEDKTSFVQAQVRDALYGVTGAPRVLGKLDADGARLVPADGELTPGRLHEPLRRVFAQVLPLTAPPAPRAPLPILPVARAPYFCSGCPHNRSTAVPDGSLAAGGIGCHTLVTTSRRTDSAVTGFTQMGGEGAQWIGQAPFTDIPHVFQNIGDGTYAHSGQLAVQACVAAGVDITFKLLHNDVVAMTGAQDAQGALSIPALTHKLAAEGVARIIVVSDDPARHDAGAMAAGTLVWHRDRMDEAQRLLRGVPGVTMLIYQQHCANDSRRQRSRGLLAPSARRVVINEDVCEGCGDCGVQSNCLSVQPVDTEFGDKTRIDQSTCNTDYSCLLGDCPAFMTVAVPERPPRAQTSTPPELPDPAWMREGAPAGTQNVLLAGVGGTGIVTVNQVLATAALRAGYAVDLLDQIGLSQKAGPVVGHLRFRADGPIEPSNRITPGRADAILAFDLLTAVDPVNLGYGDPSRTQAVAATSVTPTGAEVYDRGLHQAPVPELLERLATAAASTHTLDMLGAARSLLGSSAAANLLLVGAAVESGALRLPPSAVREAIEINGVAVAANLAALAWGRVSVADPAAFAVAVAGAGAATGGAQRRAATADSPTGVAASGAPARVGAVDGERVPAAGDAGADRDRPPASVARALAQSAFAGETARLARLRAVDLVGFQDASCAQDYVRVVDAVWRAERAVTDDTRLSEAVARYLYKLTAYKDEYEVARLLTRAEADRFARAAVPGGTDVTFRLHPPVLRALGRTAKIGFSPPTHVALRALAPMKRLRGTALDPFGHARVRRVERELLRHYRWVLHALVDGLTLSSYERAVAFAALPDLVRGYEHVKLRHVDRYVAAIADLGLPGPDLPPGPGPESPNR